MKGRCRECMRMREVTRAARGGGGSYKRAPRTYHPSICLECVERLLKHTTPGHWTVDRWNIRALEWAREALIARVTRMRLESLPSDPCADREPARTIALLRDRSRPSKTS